jgi:hypothetical protein
MFLSKFHIFYLGNLLFSEIKYTLGFKYHVNNILFTNLQKVANYTEVPIAVNLV